MKLTLDADPAEAPATLMAWARRVPGGAVVMSALGEGEPDWAPLEPSLWDVESSRLGPCGALALLTAFEVSEGAPVWAEEAWQGAVADAQGRGDAWAGLAESALVLATAFDRDSSVLRAVQDAPAYRVSEAELADAHATVASLRRTLWRTLWMERLQNTAANWTAPLRDALHTLEGGLAMAADDGATDALARVVVAELDEGELTLAVLPGGMLLEWTGDVAVQGVWLDGMPLAAHSGKTAADAAWSLEQPGGTLEVELGGERRPLRWT